MNFDDYLKGLHALYEEQSVDLKLNRGATKAQITQFSAELTSPPDDALVQAWRTANGAKQNLPCFARPGFFTPLSFLSVSDALARRTAIEKRAPNYAAYKEPKARDKRVASGWFQSGWLPFAGFGGGSVLLMSDGSPSARGQRGQVIAFVHDPDQIVFVSSSFSTFLDVSLKALIDDAEEFFLALG